jgi:antitoxin PrlF
MNKITSGKLTSKGQLTIPINLRNHLSLEEGDRLEFIIEENGEVSVTPSKKKSIRSVVGILKGDFNGDFEEARKLAQHEISRDVLKKGDN